MRIAITNRSEEKINICYMLIKQERNNTLATLADDRECKP